MESRLLCADIFNSIFATGPAVALIITLFLDNTIPGSRKERGLHVWQQLDADGTDWWEDDHMNRVRPLLAEIHSFIHYTIFLQRQGASACRACHRCSNLLR